ncbi:phosphatase PAP2 family protein [Nannocystaceae bacterium ST9]
MFLALALSLSLAPPSEPADNVSIAIEPVTIEAAPLPPREPEVIAPELEVPAPTYAPSQAPSQAPGPRLAPAPPRQPDIRFRLAIDLPITLGFAGIWGVTEGLKSRIAPQECRWCAPGPVARATRSALVWREHEAAALTSDILAYGVIPALSLTLTLVAVGRQGEWRKIHEDLLVALEAVAVSAALTNVIKQTTARRRPYAEYAAEPIPFADDPDQNLSFPSGHTSLAFALATGFATVASLRKRKLAPVFWAVGVPLAGFVGYLRMAGDRHWLGDVLVGASLGTLVGVGLPWLLHHPRTGVIPRRSPDKARTSSLRILPMPAGVALAGRF